MSAALETFLAGEPRPRDVAVELLREDADVPAGDHVGIIPLINRTIGAAELDRLPALRIVANYGVGYDNVDLAAAMARGVAVSNTPGVLTGATAELTWALILAAARRVGEAERVARGGAWTGWEPTQLLGMGLEGKVLGIVGPGRIGRAVARKAAAFGMSVLYWGRTPPAGGGEEPGPRLVPFDRLLAEADVVSLHLALAPETHMIMDRVALAAMKPGAVLVNTARGGLVDHDALADALEGGHLRAAGLDVYPEEPAVPARLTRLDNVVLLPHIGSATEEARGAMWRLAWDNLMRGVRGEALLTRVIE